jgi:hypothetical protein
MASYRVVSANDYALFAGGVRRILVEIPRVEVIGEAGDGPPLIELLKTILPGPLIGIRWETTTPWLSGNFLPDRAKIFPQLIVSGFF